MHESLPSMSKERPMGPKTPGSKRDFLVGVKWSKNSQNYSVRSTAQGELGGTIVKYHTSHAKYGYCLLIPPPHLGSHAMAIRLSYPRTWIGGDKGKHNMV